MLEWTLEGCIDGRLKVGERERFSDDERARQLFPNFLCASCDEDHGYRLLGADRLHGLGSGAVNDPMISACTRVSDERNPPSFTGSIHDLKRKF